MNRYFAVLCLCVLCAYGLEGQSSKSDNGPKDAETRTKLLAQIDSLGPCGNDTGAPKDVTFVAKTSFAGVNKEKHTLTLELHACDETCKEVASAKMQWTVSSGEAGCIQCPVSTAKTKLAAGVYVVHAVLRDEFSGTTTVVDAKACAYILVGK